jgi:hypothetical protein
VSGAADRDQGTEQTGAKGTALRADMKAGKTRGKSKKKTR